MKYKEMALDKQLRQAKIDAIKIKRAGSIEERVEGLLGLANTIIDLLMKVRALQSTSTASS